MDFLRTTVLPIKYALTVNPTNYTACIEQFWATAKVKTVNREVQIQALVDKKKVIIIETKLERMGAKTTAWNEFSSTMASAIICLATNQRFNFSKYIFDNMVKNLEGGVKFIMYPRFVQLFLDKQVEGMSKHKKIYVIPSHTKKVFANMKRQGKDFSGRDTPLFQTMMVQAQEECEGSVMPTVPQHTSTINKPSSSQPPKKHKPRKTKKQNTERTIDSENTKTSQAAEITKLKERVKKLERRNKSRTLGLKRLRKGRKIADIDVDEEVTLIDETQGRNDDNLMFDTGVLDEQEVEVEKVVSTAEVTTNCSAINNNKVDEYDSGLDRLIEINPQLKPKAVTKLLPYIQLTTDNTQAMMEADYELAQRLQVEEQGELTIEERSKLFVELMDKRKKHFAKLRAEEIRRKPPSKAQKRNQMCTYLKNMANYKHSQLKNKSFEEIQMLFDNTMKWVDLFVPMDSKVVEGSKSQAEGSKKRIREELESDNSKKQKIDKNVEADMDDEVGMKKHIEIVPDDKVAIDAIPLATKSPIINIDREDLETLWKLVKAKHGNTRLEEAYERVLWVDLKVMFKPDVESEVWRNLQGYNVTV
ncbi:hypothetical protein Tco_0953206 [Tanacetum coccineum]|uniref:Xylulose kinase-1 n=1 Tax=Tanacetum coccineum TaxID=301880 RepID=A0ABQ5E242_9ASTR